MNAPIPLETEIPDLEAAALDFESVQAVNAPEPVWTPPAAAPIWPAPHAAPAWAAGSTEADEDPAPAEDAELPPERVRFSSPLVVVVPGIDEPIDGVIVNLSESGLACVLPVALHLDERITCRFRPALGEEHVGVDGEVVWRRRAGGQDSLYGIRFAEVPAAVVERLRVVVRERVEGRAGEWPLPVVPAVAAGTRRQRPYVAFAVGVAVGALLSLGISLVPTFLLGRGASPVGVAQETAVPSVSSPTPAVEPEGVVAPSSAASPLAEAGTAAAAAAKTTPSGQAAPASTADARASLPEAALVPVVSQPAPARAADASAQPAQPAAKQVVAAPTAVAKQAPAAPTAVAKQAAAPTAVAKQAPAPTAVAKQAPAATARQSAAAPSREAHGKPTSVARARALDVSVPLDRAASSVRTFWLDGPRRFVIDVHGTRSALDSTDYPLPGALATRLRVGQHGDRVRFVVEATSAAASTSRASLEGSSLVIHLEQR